MISTMVAALYHLAGCLGYSASLVGSVLIVCIFFVGAWQMTGAGGQFALGI